MGWEQVGALAGIGCFVIAGLTLLFQIKPLPWRRAPAAMQPRFSRLMATFIVLGFSVSGIVLWSVWHQSSITVVHFPKHGMDHLKYIYGKHYVNEEIKLDGFHYDHCTFQGVTIVYDGIDEVAITNSEFRPGISFKTNSDSVNSTFELLYKLGYIKPGIPFLNANKEPIPDKPMQGTEQIH